MHNVSLGRIMVVDDEVEVITLLHDFLSELGYEVVVYTSCKAALEALKEKKFDLLLTDLIMPDMDGICFFQSAQKIDPLLVCIMITGHGTIKTAVEATKSGVFDYITKPPDWKTLQPLLSRAMELRRLRKSEAQYRGIVEDQTELICRCLPDGVILFVNEVFCQFFGKTREELTGQSYESLMPSEDYKRLKEHLGTLNKENPVALIELQMILPGDKVRWMQWTNRAIFDEKGNITEFQSVGRDITDRKQIEEDLRRSHDQLRTFAKWLSEAEEHERQRITQELHDQVGQNLTALGINLGMLRNQVSDRLTYEIEFRLGDSIRLLEDIGKRIRDLMADLRPSELDDYGLMAAVRWYSDQFSKRTKLSIIVHGEERIPRLPSEVEINLFRITQEVLTNVAKHAKASRIHIHLDAVDGNTRLTIIDNGIGFDPVGFKHAGERSGWGLLNIRERAFAIGGKLIVESEPGKGTKVVIEIQK
jgi:two-component system sensor histidine kinase UhpB